MKTSRKLLLGFYAVVPLVMAIVAVDAALFGYSLRDSLPGNPEAVRLFMVFFVLPHILASLTMYLDVQYLSRYRWRLLLGIPTLSAAVFVGSAVVGIVAVAYLYMVATVYHVVGQQLGVSRMLAGRTDWTYSAWKWSLLTLGWILYAELLAPGFLGTALGLTSHEVYAFCFGAYGATTLLGPRILRLATSRLGKAYVVANQVLIGAIGVASLAGYPFFALLMPRIIHDCTAFAFYVPHDVNRNRDVRHNLFYRAFAAVPIPVAVLGPVAAIGAAYPLVEWSRESWTGDQVVMTLAFAHYFMESFGWRRDSLPRKSVELA